MSTAHPAPPETIASHRSTGISEATPAFPPSQPSSYFVWKSVFDRVLAVLLLPVAIPIIGALLVLIRATSAGPGIFRQTRVGRLGKPYTMYKLRSMTTAAEKNGPQWSPPKGDARVTRIGFWLRKLHLDELPQLFNVLKGQMSLIGPRPERPEFVEVLADQIPGYRRRLAVLPGITGLSQVNLPPDTDLNSVRQKQILDLEYIDHANLMLDIRLFACTIAKMFGLPALAVARLLGICHEVELAEEIERESVVVVPLQGSGQNDFTYSYDDQHRTIRKAR